LERAAGAGRVVARVRRRDERDGAREAAARVQSCRTADRRVPRYGGRLRRGRVPVEFIVHPCIAVPIGFNVARTDSLTTWDCAAPHRANSFARVYSFAAN